MRRFLPFIIANFIRLLHATLRVQHIRAENLTSLPQYIISFWHQHLVMMLHSRFRHPIVVISSWSRDGETSARTFGQYGVENVRGSSTRGGTAALRGLIRAAREGKNIVFTPDGPRGPVRVAKEGVIIAAQATGLPIVPIAFAAKKKSCCAHGIAWSSRFHSRARPSSTARRSPCRVTAMSRSGADGWRGR